jgi:Predicted transcriptional regulators
LLRHSHAVMLYGMRVVYGQFCPPGAAAEVFARRWTPLIPTELLSGARRFAGIHRGAPRISRNLLAPRRTGAQRDYRAETARTRARLRISSHCSAASASSTADSSMGRTPQGTVIWTPRSPIWGCSAGRQESSKPLLCFC